MDRLTMILISIFVTLPLLCYVLRTSSIFQNPTYIRKEKKSEPLPKTEYVYILIETGEITIGCEMLKTDTRLEYLGEL